MYVCSACGIGNVAHHLFVESCHDDAAALVSFVVAGASAGQVFRYGRAGGQAHADGAYAHALLVGVAGGVDGVVFVVLAVADDDDGAPFVCFPLALGVAVAEGLHGFLDGVADGGALRANHVAAYLVEEELCGAVVAGERHLYKACAGEDHQADAVAGQRGEEVADHALAAFQAVGLYVFGHHRVRYIEAYRQVAAGAFAFLYLGAELGVGQGHDEQR